MNARAIIAAVLFVLGMMFCIGAVGHLDFMDECGEIIQGADILGSVVRGVVGIGLMGMSLLVGKGVEFDEED